ncbi:MAG: hypothetical protein E6J91_27115, partial [Deltaproteobacteria bacterium]
MRGDEIGDRREQLRAQPAGAGAHRVHRRVRLGQHIVAELRDVGRELRRPALDDEQPRVAARDRDRRDVVVGDEVGEQHRSVVEQRARPLQRRGPGRAHPCDQRVAGRDGRLDVVERPQRVAPALALRGVVVSGDDLLVELGDVGLDLALAVGEQRR